MVEKGLMEGSVGKVVQLTTHEDPTSGCSRGGTTEASCCRHPAPVRAPVTPTR